MAQNMQHTAELIKTTLREKPEEGRQLLLSFAEKYVITKRIQHAALILSQNYSNTKDPALKESIITDMEGLVDEIVVDYREHSGTQEAKRLQEARAQLEKGYLQTNLPDDVVCECKHLRKSFGKGKFTLGDIDITLRLGQITGVVGENANGKTTLFRVVVGELQHDSGELSYPYLMKDEKDKQDWLKIKSQISYVPQELASWGGDLKNSIKYEAALHNVTGKENESATNYIIQRLGLEDHLTKHWSQLSGGFKLRFALARALVWKPKLLVIDEPLANLDIKTQVIIMKDLADMARSLRYPMAMLISSQHLHEIEAISDKILFMDNGQMAFYGDTGDIGKIRKTNTFELDCKANLVGLQEALKPLGTLDIHHNGLIYIIKTPLNITYQELFQKLLLNKIQVRYFRDISQSVKSFFE